MFSLFSVYYDEEAFRYRPHRRSSKFSSSYRVDERASPLYSRLPVPCGRIFLPHKLCWTQMGKDHFFRSQLRFMPQEIISTKLCLNHHTIQKIVPRSVPDFSQVQHEDKNVNEGRKEGRKEGAILSWPGQYSKSTVASCQSPLGKHRAFPPIDLVPMYVYDEVTWWVPNADSRENLILQNFGLDIPRKH